MSEPTIIYERLKAQSLLHAVSKHSLLPPWPEYMETAIFGMGCFWGAEQLFWQQAGVFVTMSGYCGGHIPDPVYKEICMGETGHAEVVRIIFDPSIISYKQLLTLFWENHQPNQGNRQGNDIGSQYRSCIFTYNNHQKTLAELSKKQYQKALKAEGIKAAISTEIHDAAPFYYAEDYHQQYLAKNPQGYCGLRGLGVCMPGENI